MSDQRSSGSVQSRDVSGSDEFPDPISEPTRTPGQAEGTEDFNASPPAEPGRTGGQAEGDFETVEQDLGQKGLK
ncbi:MAG TPA: hypothetical protein VHL09_03990 [Dehalococcoidia bacterium]|nr:hypothetical protein [Dehalococcoidia bacterium]